MVLDTVLVIYSVLATRYTLASSYLSRQLIFNLTQKMLHDLISCVFQNLIVFTAAKKKYEPIKMIICIIGTIRVHLLIECVSINDATYFIIYWYRIHYIVCTFIYVGARELRRKENSRL